MANTPDFSALRAEAMGSSLGEEAVTVNTRALIDKVLARYSGEWTVLRELLQNAADASASKVTIRFETMPSSTVPVPQSPEPSTILKHTILNHTLKRLLVSNDGKAFGPNDWSRLKRIAEGNPDETKIGAFGVGFYSVFADCEEPFVQSGGEAMAFYWKGNSLFTRRLQLSVAQSNLDTNFVLDYRNNTSPIPNLLTLCQFLASSITFVGLSQVELWLDDVRLLSLTKLTAPGVDVKIPKTLETKTHEGLFRIESVARETAQLEAKWLNIVRWKHRSSPSISNDGTQSSTVKGATSTQSLKTFFSRFAQNANTTVANKAAHEEKLSQNAISEDLVGECKVTVFLHIHIANVRARINATFSQELERATKKPPPKVTKLAILTTSYDETAASTSSVSGTASKSVDIFASVLPSKSGRIFIGFPTHQTTGLNAHISAPSVIPTVERESIDLNARWVRMWNMEMLRAAGIVCRIAWSGDITHVKERLAQSLKDSTETKTLADHIDKVLPEAIHMLNQFTFRESTPSSQVGTLIEEAFWTCNHNATIEILSSCGIMPSQDVRIATEDLSFVEGIPVLPPELMKHANAFIKRLMDYGIITEITTSDIKKELERQALNEKQLVEFLQWLGHKASINEVEPVIVRSLLDVAVANEGSDDKGSGKLVVLGEIKHFVNPSRIPGAVPVPSDTLSFKFTKMMDKSLLEALGWEDLQLVPWLRWLVEMAGGRGSLSKDQDLTLSPLFASVVLPIVSKQWEGLSQSSKATVVNLLSSRTVIPTRLGMRQPAESYFPSVKVFDDLPVVTGLHSVKDKLLVALGVRKTIELGLVFERLISPPEYSADASLVRPAWSHVDLIRYLASVRSDIPPDDVKRLRATAICPAELRGGKASDQRYPVTELFEPNDTLRALGIKLLQWPGVFHPGSEEGRFLTFLGLKPFPGVAELIPLIASAAANGDLGLRDRALKYFVNFHFQHGCSVQKTATTEIPYLPLEGEDSKISVLPTQCYTHGSSNIMGFRILRKDLHPHAGRLGVEAHPPILDCVDRLVQSPPENHRSATAVFNYFATRLNDLTGRPLEILSQASFIPVPATARTSTSKGSIRHLPPRLCFLGASNDDRYAEIFDYADFGSSANSFLLRCGSKHEPSTQELAQLVVREPARVFTVFDSPDRYLDLLRTLAASWPSLKKDKALVKDMKKARFLLGYKEFAAQNYHRARQSRLGSTMDGVLEEDDTAIRTYELAAADEVVIVDDVISYNLFKGNFLAAPMEEDLENFYLSLGSVFLANMVDQKFQIGQPVEDQRDASKLEKLIQERIKLFVHEIPADHIQHNAAWIEKNLSIVVVKSLAIKKSLRTQKISHTEAKTAIQAKDQQVGLSFFSGHALFVIPGTRDLYDVSQAVSALLLTRPKPRHALTLMVLLETDLYKLRLRGYNVERILQKKAADKKIAEEKRREQLQIEQQSIDEQATRDASQLQIGNGISDHPMMPGLFPDSPDHRGSGSHSNGHDANTSGDKKRSGFFNAITRALGGDDGRRLTQLGEGGSLPPPPYSTSDPDQAMTTTPPQPVTAPHQLQQNLINAIKSSRAYNSQSVISRPEVNNVSETQTFCDAKPAQDITFYSQTSFGVKLYLSKSLADKNKFMAENSTALNAFAGILMDCADTLALSRASVHIFHDHGSSTIAFNQSQALFFNYRYFESLHLPSVLHGKKGEAIIYWFVVLCHELAHNLVADHSSAHSYYTESFLVQYFTRVAHKVATSMQQGVFGKDEMDLLD